MGDLSLKSHRKLAKPAARRRNVDESINRGPLDIGQLPPTLGVVDKYFNDSTGEGEHGEYDATGPWNTGDGWQIENNPAFQQLKETSGQS